MADNKASTEKDVDMCDSKEPSVTQIPSFDDWFLGRDYRWYCATDYTSTAGGTSMRSSSSSSCQSVSSNATSVASNCYAIRLDSFMQVEYTQEAFWQFVDPVHGNFRNHEYSKLLQPEYKFKRISDILFHTEWRKFDASLISSLFSGKLWICGKDDLKEIKDYLHSMEAFISDVNNMWLADLKKDWPHGKEIPRLSDRYGRPLELHIESDLEWISTVIFDSTLSECKYCKGCLQRSSGKILKSIDLWFCNRCLLDFMVGRNGETLKDKIQRLKVHNNKFSTKVEYMMMNGPRVGGLPSCWQNTYEHRALDIRNYIWSINDDLAEKEKQFYEKGLQNLIDINWRFEGFYC